MTEKDIINKFITAHSNLPSNIDECAKLISDRDWITAHYPNSIYKEALNRYVEDIKRIYFEHESANNIFLKSIREEC